MGKGNPGNPPVPDGIGKGKEPVTDGRVGSLDCAETARMLSTNAREGKNLPMLDDRLLLM